MFVTGLGTAVPPTVIPNVNVGRRCKRLNNSVNSRIDPIEF